jgi:acid phosphatase
MDLDETVLDNSPFVAHLIKENRSYGADLWTAWVSKSQSKPLPGALDFVEYVRGKGVKVFFVTNREHETEPATRRNLRSFGLQITAGTDTVLTRNERPNWSQDKASRRRFVAERFRILLLFGNELEDFVSTGRSTPEARVRLMEKYGTFWGERWFLFPNPVYGPWERALYNYDTGLSKDEKIRRKYERLETPK